MSRVINVLNYRCSEIQTPFKGVLINLFKMKIFQNIKIEFGKFSLIQGFICIIVDTVTFDLIIKPKMQCFTIGQSPWE